MTRNVVLRGLGIGLSAGAIVALAMTVKDWRLNPAGIFHDAHGTDWSIVTETAVSWFVPVSVLCSALALSVFFIISRRQRSQVPTPGHRKKTQRSSK